MSRCKVVAPRHVVLDLDVVDDLHQVVIGDIDEQRPGIDLSICCTSATPNVDSSRTVMLVVVIGLSPEHRPIEQRLQIRPCQ